MKQWLVQRGVLATLPLTVAAAFVLDACSSEPGVPGADRVGHESARDTPQTDAAEFAASPRAAARLERLTKQFVHVPVEPKLAPLRVPPGALPPRPVPPEKPLEPRPVLRKGDVAHFVRQGSRLRAQLEPDSARSLLKPAAIELPLRSEGFVRVQPESGKIGVEFAPKDAKPGIEVEIAEGTASYPGAGPHGSDLVLRITGDAVEDFFVLQQKPAEPFVEYTVKTEEVKGLRLYDNTIEFLDAGGDPQLRVKPPGLVDSDGVWHQAYLSLPDCHADTSGVAPWGRAVTAPGAAQCTVRVRWTDTTVIYPAIVDPVWATAGSLATERWKNSAVRMSTGFVLTCGGEDKNGVPLKSCETFNPAASSGAGSWSSTVSMNMGTGRKNFSLLSLAPASTDVVAVGSDTTVFTSERYNGTSWTASTGDFSTGYFQPQPIAAVTSDGAYVVVVDYDDTPYRLPTANNTWNTGTTNPAPIHPYRYNATLVGLPGQGTIMRAGGYYSSNYTDVERYKPSTDSWSTPGNATALTVARYSAPAAILDSNRIMIYGGYAGGQISSGEIYNVATNSWSFTTDPLPSSYSATSSLGSSTFAFHGSGKMLSATDGGLYLYDPLAASNPWTIMNTYNQGFYSMGSSGNIVAAGSKVLMVPVQPQGNNSGVQTACRLFDFGDKGSICTATFECQAGLQCVSEDGVGVCCDSACSNACSSCRAANKQSQAGDGTCGPRSTQAWVGYTACPSTESTTCGTQGGYCDGNGGCMMYPPSTTCAYQGCADTDTQNNERKCDGKGNCVKLTTADCATGYQCVFNACVNYCYDDSYCSSTYYCQYWSNPNVTYDKCQPKKANGATCSYSNSECSSGFCIDGVCCDKACNGTCEACSSALTGQTNGACKPIPAGQSSGGECYDSGPGNCAYNGLCNGSAGCQLYASGTQCNDIGSCSGESARFIPDTCNGTGSCVDKGTAACNAGYACLSGVCQTTCTSDTQCASSYWCDTVNKVCVADRDPGQSCSKDATCKGNANCVDGVCCDSACSGTCRSCLKNKTGLAADGVCGNVVDDTDPDGECQADVGYPASCKAPGTCDGQGSCRVYAKVGTVAKANVCSTTTLTQTSCDGAGNLDPRDTPCYPYKCNATGNGCRVACTKGTEAQDCDGAFCGPSGTCLGQKLNGSECRDNTECKSQHCANIGKEPKTDIGAGGEGAGGASGNETSDAPGVCCDSDCGSPCEACKKSIKGEGTDGTCGPVQDHTDPAGDCPVDANNPCGHNGQCDGDRHCRNVPGGTACGATKCIGNSVQGQRCDGLGACINNDGTTACAPYVCRESGGAEQCTNPCANDNDCADGYFCEEQSCKKKLANGKTCATSGICNSGFCVDGLCCDVSCNGQCEACDSAGNEGVCTAVKGEPHGNRVKCDHAGEECGGQCDGVNPSACKYKPNGDACGTPTCNNDLASSSSCNGQGECKANKNTECSPYTCGPDDLCLERCQQDADCGQGYACDETTQRCLPAAVSATCSEDRLTSQGQNGANTPCKPFLCVPASGTCAVSCAFTTDCSPDFVCEPSTKTCLPAPADSGGSDDTSCACRAAGAAPKSSSYLALAALGVALTGLRRRRPRRATHFGGKQTRSAQDSPRFE